MSCGDFPIYHSLFFQKCAIISIMVSSIREIGENIKNSPLFIGDINYDVPMSEHTTMKVGGSAPIFIEPENEISLAQAVSTLKSQGIQVFVLGGGSNTVVRDGEMQRAVISMSRLNAISIESKNAAPFEIEDFPEVKEAAEITLTAGAGVTIEALNAWCVKYGILGFETFAGLPGTVGGATFMNARCYGTDFSTNITEIKYLDLDRIPASLEKYSEYDLKYSLDDRSFISVYTKDESNSGTDWGYKQSPMQKKNAVILSVKFALRGIDLYVTAGQSASPRISDYIWKKNAEKIADRTEKGQFKAPSAGSVFKNNRDYGKPSGAIIDELGMKGTKIGGAQVAPWHGNFIINMGNATSDDVEKLVNFVMEKVSENTGYNLEPEIIFV